MYAIAFDLNVAITTAIHPKGLRRAYDDIQATLAEFGFTRVQGSLFISDHTDLGRLMTAVLALKQLPWFPEAVRDIRGFRVEDWSDLTGVVKSP